MNLLVLLIQISLINCFNISETSNKFKSILKKYKNNRLPRDLNKINSFIGETLDFLDKTQRFGEFLKFYNVSDCSRNNKIPLYTKEHILDGLLIHEDVPKTHWDEYKEVHKKVYVTPHHEMAALAKWRQNLKRVARHNQEYMAGKQTYSLHLNHFGDMHVTEYFRKVLKLIKTVPLFDPSEDRHKNLYRKSLKCKPPQRVDWRNKGFKPKREEQWHCGACYAFAVTHALQAQLYKAHGKWGELSPQQIVDCSFKDGNMGCDGGSLKAALRYASRDGLIMESHYPYVGKKGHCKYKKEHVLVRAQRWATLPARDEIAMERMLATVGPLAVAVNAAPYTFQLYRSGVYDDPFCTSWHLNHAMLLVGYTPQYWILLNWWGKNWGEDGYMRIRRGFNRCGVANMATYVEI